MVKLLQQFLILVIIIYCLNMIYFYFRNKSKKYKSIPSFEMSYLIRMYGINISKIGIKLVEKHISIVNAIIVSIDLLIYYNISNLLLRMCVVFIITIMLVFLLYNILGTRYKKMTFK